jgi:hypothetical protein
VSRKTIKKASPDLRKNMADGFEPSSSLPEIPWPQLGDSLFLLGDDWWMNARLDIYGVHWDTYARGYKCAADALVEHAAKHKHELDSLVYPIIFLYRHYLELRMKELILTGSRLPDVAVREGWRNTHDLTCLWGCCRQVLQKVWPEGPKRDLDAVQNCIQQLAQVDAKSEVFRYPSGRQGESFETKPSHINLRNFAEVVGRVAGLLDSAGMGVSACIEDVEQAK